MNGSENIPGRGIPALRQVDAALRQVGDRMHRSLQAHDVRGELASFVGHLQACRGKMLRPGMLLLAGECFEPVTEEHIQVAAMVEMIHQATLLHDDVIDDGRQRRGIPTVNLLWGNESAVLLGDLILSEVFRMAAELGPATARILSQTAVRVCEGELRQTLQRRNWQLDETRYLEIITEKSASFFGGCCRLGAMLARAPEDQVEALARFGLLAGVGFQIMDDLLDVTGDETRMGKTAQSDFAMDKPTLAVIHLLRTAEGPRKARVGAILESSPESRPELVDLLERSGSLQYARGRAADYGAQAAQAIENVPASRAKEALLEIARFMADRTV
jgi:octaprenyl-diphosphate synthase